MSGRVALAFLISFCYLAPSLAYWDHGHMLPAAMVRLRAEKKEQGAVKIEDIRNFEELGKLMQLTNEIPSNHTFLATWEWCPTIPDYWKQTVPRWIDGKKENGLLLRAMADKRYDHFHYYNLHQLIEKMQSATDLWPEFQDLGHQVPDNIVWMAHDLDERLTKKKSGGRYPFYPEYTWTPSSLYNQVCLWMHLMGDIVQPMHVGGIKSTCYKNGDLGGNLIELETDPAKMHPHYKSLYQQTGVKNLHLIWDSMLWYPGSIEGEDKTEASKRSGYVETYADRFVNRDAELWKDAERLLNEFPYDDTVAEFPANDEYYAMANTTVWWYRHHAVNVEDFPQRVYKCAEGEKPEKFNPTDQYIEQAHTLTKKSVAVAAYRMEYRLAKMFRLWDLDALIEDTKKVLKDNILKFVDVDIDRIESSSIAAKPIWAVVAASIAMAMVDF